MKGRVPLILGCFSVWLFSHLLAAESDLRRSVRSATERLRKQAGVTTASQDGINSGQNPEKMIPVYVVLRGDPAVRTVLRARTSSLQRSTTTVKRRISQMRAQQESVLTRLRYPGQLDTVSATSGWPTRFK